MVRLLALVWLSAALTARAREPAPPFRLMDSHGRWQTLESFRGRAVILNLWATWCAPCRKEVPWLNDLHRRYEARGLTVVGMALDEQGWKAVKPFLAQYDVRYPVLLADRKAARAYRGTGTLPRTLFLDRQGNIVLTHDAILGPKSLEELAEALLRDSP